MVRILYVVLRFQKRTNEPEREKLKNIEVITIIIINQPATSIPFKNMAATPKTSTPASNDKKEVNKSATSETKAPEAVMEAIEEDDEFEEFEPCNWSAKEEDTEDAQQWKDNWDDDDIEDDFTKSLRAELSKTVAK